MLSFCNMAILGVVGSQILTGFKLTWHKRGYHRMQRSCLGFWVLLHQEFSLTLSFPHLQPKLNREMPEEYICALMDQLTCFCR